MKDLIHMLKIVVDFLDRTTQAELDDLMTCKAKLKIEYTNAKPTKPSLQTDINEIMELLKLFTSVDEAKDFLVKKNCCKATLKKIAEDNHVVLISKDTNEQIIDKIIERLIGSKLRYDSLLNMDTR